MEDEDPYNIGGYSSSDDGQNESSGDELDEEGVLKQQRQESSSSSEDEFEKEMEMELESVMKTFENDHGGDTKQKANPDKTAGDAGTSGINGQSTEQTSDMYSEDYFSSGSEDEHLVGGQGSKSKERRKVLTNDELFYDPDMDDEDEKWVAKQRRDHRQKVQERNASNVAGTGEKQDSSTANKKKSKISKQEVEKVPSSDAILSCPACMTTLCIDCQRHDLYKNQYRAMFVMNCKVVEDEVLRYEPFQQRNPGKRRKKGQKGKLVQHSEGGENSTATGGAATELYHPVTCTECSSEVAVYDSDEVYHFFNVLASHA